jgi:hypothetical protein
LLLVILFYCLCTYLFVAFVELLGTMIVLFGCM